MENHSPRAGEIISAHRQHLGLTQGAFASLLNRELGRKYDRQQISRWEIGAERIPLAVSEFVTSRAAEFKPSAMFTLTIANQKGGVGKTSLAVNTAYTLARMGYKTLLVDLDSQANATMLMGIAGDDLSILGERRQYIGEVLIGRKALDDVLISTDYENLSLAPSHIMLALAEDKLKASMGNDAPLALRKALAGVKERFDFCVVDCAPSLSLLTVCGLIAGNRVLIPVLTEPHALAAVYYLLRTVESARMTNPSLEVLGIVPTMFMGRNSQDLETLKILSEQYGQFFQFPPIPRSTVWSQGPAIGRPTLSFDHLAPGREVYTAIAQKLIQAAVPAAAAAAAVSAAA